LLQNGKKNIGLLKKKCSVFKWNENNRPTIPLSHFLC